MVNETEVKGVMLSEAVYDRMKFVALVLLPALQTLYFTLGAIWDLPSVEQVIGTLASVDTFLGVILGLSTKSYNSSDAKYDGKIVLKELEDGKKLYSLELDGDPQDLDQKKEVTFKIDSASPSDVQ